MFLTKNFENIFSRSVNDVVIKRNGVADSLVVPKQFKSHQFFDANIVGNHIELSPGQTLCILADEFGVVNNGSHFEVDLVFIEGGVLVQLLDGKLAIKDREGVVYCVDSDGEISYPRSNSKVVFTTANNLFGVSEMIVETRYGCVKSSASSYVNNLLFSVIFNANSNGFEPCMSARFVTQYEDIGLGFPFLNFNEIKDEIAYTSDDYDMDSESDDWSDNGWGKEADDLSLKLLEE